MGIRLIVEVLDHAPAELTAQQRLLLLALAETARDETRTCWPGMEMLTRRTGLSDRRVRAVLAQLEQRCYEVRVAAGTDKNGKQTFAHHGHATIYRLPCFRQSRSDPTTLKPVGSGRLDEGKAAGSGKERRQNPVTKAAGSDRPFPQKPSREPSHHPRARGNETAAVIEALRERTGRTIDEHHATLVVRQLLNGRDGIRDRAKYLTGAIRNDSNPHRFLPTPGPPPYQREEN
jgi:hypothetical protein